MPQNKLQTLDHIRQEAREKREGLTTILVCGGTGCVAGGSMEVYDALVKCAEARGLNVLVKLEDHVDHGDDTVAVKASGCHGFCEMGPLVRIEPEGTMYTKVKAEDAEEIIEKLGTDSVVERLLYRHPVTQEVYVKEEDIPFYSRQQRLLWPTAVISIPAPLRTILPPVDTRGWKMRWARPRGSLPGDY